MDVANSALAARTAERAVAQQNLDEGAVLAPVAGRVITVPLTKGSVVLNGDTVATIGEQPFMLRLRIPERHALSLKVGDTVRIDAGQLGVAHAASGTITLIYPQIEEGRVVADVARPGHRRLLRRRPDLGLDQCRRTAGPMWCPRALCIPASGWIS